MVQCILCNPSHRTHLTSRRRLMISRSSAGSGLVRLRCSSILEWRDAALAAWLLATTVATARATTAVMMTIRRLIVTVMHAPHLHPPAVKSRGSLLAPGQMGVKLPVAQPRNAARLARAFRNLIGATQFCAQICDLRVDGLTMTSSNIGWLGCDERRYQEALWIRCRLWGPRRRRIWYNMHFLVLKHTPFQQLLLQRS